MVSDGSLPETLAIDQDAQIYVSTLKQGQNAEHRSRPGRKAYLFVISGGVTLNGKPLAPGDQARVTDQPELKLQAQQESDLILLDLPEVSGRGAMSS